MLDWSMRKAISRFDDEDHMNFTGEFTFRVNENLFNQ